MTSLDPRSDADRSSPSGDPVPFAPSAAEPGHSDADLAQERAEMAGVMGTPLTRALRLGALVALVVGLGVWRGLPIVVVILAIVLMIFLHELGH